MKKKRTFLWVLVILTGVILVPGLYKFDVSKILAIQSNSPCECDSEMKCRPDVIKSDSRSNHTTPWITVEHTKYMRLGNSLFMFAALSAIAKKNNLTPVYPKTLFRYLKDTFDMPCDYEICDGNEDWMKGAQVIHQNDISSSDLLIPGNLSRTNIKLKGYFCARVYIRSVEDWLRDVLKFKEIYLTAAREFLDKEAAPGIVRVGIHIRAGDWETPQRVKDGYIIPGPDYFKRAMAFFVQIYHEVQFIVCSHDRSREWILEHLHSPRLFISKFTTAGGDMALLSLCDHVITSIGSYGEWGGWFSDGIMVYPIAGNQTSATYRPYGRKAIGIPREI